MPPHHMIEFGQFPPTAALRLEHLCTSRVPMLAAKPATDIVSEVAERSGRVEHDTPVEVSPPLAYGIELPSGSWWEEAGRAFKQAVMKCFCFGEEVALWERQRSFDREVARERLHTLKSYTDNTVTETVVAQLHEVNAEDVHQVPRFVGHVVDGLRLKLGMGAANRSVPGNVALVRAEAAKMMRDWNVRTRDAAAHLLLVERAFFEENVHERPTTWRVDCKRKSRFIGWLLGSMDESPKFDY